MALVLREIENIIWWSFDRSPTEGWLGQSESRGDVLKGLKATNSALSIFVIDDDSSEQIERTFAAFAAARGEPGRVDFAIVQHAELAALDLNIAEELGKTPDAVVNQWHRNVIQLSAGRIHSLAQFLQTHAVFCRKRETEVLKLVRNGVEGGHIDQSRVSPKILQKIGVQ